MPPLPDWLLMRMTSLSYFLPMSVGSMDRYGTVHRSGAFCSRQRMPLVMASWCPPENAANTSCPA